MGSSSIKHTNQLEATRTNIVKEKILWFDIAMADVQHQVAELQRTNLMTHRRMHSGKLTIISRRAFHQQVQAQRIQLKTYHMRE
jgi:hypothetical protein